MRTEDIKGDTEVKVFKEFVKLSGLPISINTVQKRKPPEPDILCRDNSSRYIAFELVEICDSLIAKTISNCNEEPQYIRTSDPSRNVIIKKLSRKYETEHTIELLCYIGGRVITPDNIIIPTILPVIESISSQFKKVWFLGEKNATLLWQTS